MIFTRQREDFEFPDGYKHQFDIVVRKENAIGSTIIKFIEIGDVGDDSKHQLPHKSQLINDGIAKAHVEQYYPDAKYMKLNKEDVFYRKWLFKELGL